MNKFTITIDTELNKDNLERRFHNDMIFHWLKIWVVRIEEK